MVERHGPPAVAQEGGKPSLDPMALGMLTRFLQHNKDYAIICMDPDGVITAWLGAATSIFGFTAEEIVGETAHRIFTREDLVRNMDRYELEVAASDSRAEDDRWHVRSDGTRIWATGTVTAVRDESGKLTGFIKIARDRTDRRGQVEFLETHVQSLEASRDRTHRFIKTLGHELRNPLGPLSNAVHILRQHVSDVKMDSIFQVISRQASALLRLADDLMDITRFETGKVELDLKPYDLRQVLDDAVASLQGAAQHKNVRLKAVLPETPLMVALDEGRFQRLVLNLLTNGIKYTGEGGSVWVKATEEDDEVLLRVEDDGIGIAPEVLPRIFELFTQERSAASSAPGGLGIGLTVVREIAELHGGSVQARSGGKNRGAEFTVRLPALRSAQPGKP